MVLWCCEAGCAAWLVVVVVVVGEGDGAGVGRSEEGCQLGVTTVTEAEWGMARGRHGERHLAGIARR